MGESGSEKIQQEANALTKNEHQRAKLVNDITKMLESVQPLPSPKCCIYKVPDPLRKLNEEAYTPQVISIGPFHHGNKKLQTMENYKARYLKRFIERAKIDLKNLICAIENAEKDVRQCYAEIIPLSSDDDDFVKMILMDASFIIEFFLRNRFNEWTSDDKIVLKPWLAARMQLDLILFENQLPFFIIDKLFNLAFPSSPGFPSFVELTFEYFHSYNRQERSPDPKLEILHFVDLLRNFYLPPHLPKRMPKIIEHMYSATQLDGVGLKFQADRSSNCLLDLDLDYKKGVLKIPHFTLDNATELYARNLMALEQCHYPNAAYVTDYFILLDFLINTEKDVELLSQKGIMVNGLGDYDATFINKLGTSIICSTMSSNYYDLCVNLKSFYEDPSHGWLASLRKDYFGTPWKATSTTAAIILLILTLIQTVCSLISV